MSMKILIVDDEADQLDALERSLRGDFEIIRADSGGAALKAITAHPDLCVVLSDLRMPGIGGLEVLAHAKTVAPSATRVAASGAIDVRGMAEAINGGSVDRFVLKPWDADYLRLQMLEAQRAHIQLQEKVALERLASTDPLTEIANRRHFDARLKIELDRSERHGRPVSLALIDVDSFKALNDRLGHQAGDAFLQKLAVDMAAHVRNLDFIARFGGDEFAIIMPDATSTEAQLVAERLRASVESGSVTISIGVAAFAEHANSVVSLVHAADQALYRAKGQGRNQTVVATAGALIK